MIVIKDICLNHWIPKQRTSKILKFCCILPSDNGKLPEVGLQRLFWYFLPKVGLPYKRISEISVAAKGENFNDHNWALVLTKNPPGSGCTGKVRECPGRHPSCCTWQEYQLWNSTRNGSQTFIWDLLSPKFKVKLQLHLIFLFFLGNKSCDWDPTKNSPQARGVPATQVLLTLLLLPNTENTPVLSSHVKKRIIPKILLQLRWVLGNILIPDILQTQEILSSDCLTQSFNFHDLWKMTSSISHCKWANRIKI